MQSGTVYSEYMPVDLAGQHFLYVTWSVVTLLLWLGTFPLLDQTK
jgi:hypothetical protein